MQVLVGSRVLLVEDDDDARFLWTAGLQFYGAQVIAASSGARAIASVGNALPHVLVSDLWLSDMRGSEVLQRLRRIPGLATLPAIALTRESGPIQREAAGFEKCLLRPMGTIDLVFAIVGVDKDGRFGNTPRAVRTLLAELNAKSPCRFTSLIRFTEHARLSSVWTHDRENPDVDPFPLGLPIQASYCALVQSTNDTFVVEDARTDPRTLHHPKRDELASYIGVPLRDTYGRVMATVCCYDERPMVLDATVRTEVEIATRALETALAWLVDASLEVA